MGPFFKLLTPFFAPIFEFFKSLAMGLFIYRAGKKDVALDNLKTEVKNVKLSKKISSGVDAMSDDALRSLLKSRKPDHK